MGSKKYYGYSSRNAFGVAVHLKTLKRVSELIEHEHSAWIEDSQDYNTKRTMKMWAARLATWKVCKEYEGKTTQEGIHISKAFVKEYVTKFINAIQEN